MTKSQKIITFGDQSQNNTPYSPRSCTLIECEPFIGTFEDTPQYMRDDKLYAGYRINFNSYGKILKSLFQIHNQTVNIWTHFGGALIMIIIIFSALYYEIDYQKSNLINYNINKTNKFKKLIQNYSIEDNQCHLKYVQMVNKELIPIEIKQKVKNQVCHPHGKHYFGDFLCQIAQKQIQLIKNYVLTNFGQNMKKIQRAKLHWEKQVIPNIVHEVQKQSNFSVINYLRQKVQQLRIQMDQQQYEYLDFDFGDHIQNPEKISRFPLIIFLICAIVCLGCSSAFHLFNPMSSKAYQISISLDYAGINVFISGSVFPAFYYGMYCYFNVAYFYMAIIFLIGGSLFALSLTQWFKSKDYFVFKSICYGGFAFFLTIPISHLIINQVFFDNYGDQFSFLPSLHWYILGAVSDTLGLIIFTKRCPDRNNPGKYDVCGHSHQIWHTLILAGMFFLYFGACTNYETRKQFTCSAYY